ncbi:Ferredoxin-type protein NapG (periplasmic nitrate reductase) [hydrothermal vent metagenome]|uniref:Ferredoxin-type protein NapG (Periplasmic nitrate reductase) n=1 Tax=hydrothermal vent metagenome TaxID=652676 RepID=A0A1W1BUF5_9ZZZZ
MKNETGNERRKFLLTMARDVGLLAFGGFIWSAYVDEAVANKLALRPPGALKGKDFLSTCIKCGLCVEACPYDTLKLASPGENIPIGTPYFEPRDVPCYMCPDIPCVPACPTGALDKESVSTDGKLDIDKADMGVAIVDTKNCIAFWGIQCDACYRACPVMDKALYLEYDKNERTGKHAFLKPVVDPDYCTGCGMCEHACVTKKPAIIVRPRELVMGEVGSHYVKGWDKKDEKRLQKAEAIHTVTPRSKRKAIDTLNDMGGLLDD